MNYSIAFTSNVNARNAIASVTVRNVLLVTAIATLEVANVIKSLYLIAEWLLCEVASYSDATPSMEWNEHITVRFDHELEADTFKPQAIHNALTFVVALVETLTSWVNDSPTEPTRLANVHNETALNALSFKELRAYASTFLGIKAKSRKDITLKILALA